MLQQDAVLQYDIDIQDLLKKNNIVSEEIVYKNESDLQQTLATLLPPQEVFTSTMFLLQNSDNIFSLAPAERIDILKNIFNLLSIDEAKERIDDKRREIKLQKKILADTTGSDSKLRATLQSLLHSFTQLSGYPQWVFLSKYTSSTRELANIADKIQIHLFSIPTVLQEMVTAAVGYIETQKKEYHSSQQTAQHLQDSITTITGKTHALDTEIQ